jgi:glycosyltransferase involved in cell wall biosynthesis
MRITYLGPLPPHLGGIAQHGANVADALLATGNGVQRLSWRRPYPARLYPGDLVDPLAAPAPNVRYLLDWHDPGTWGRAGRAAARGDAVVLPWVTTVHGPATAVVLRATRELPRIAIVHNALPHERHPFDATISRMVLRRFDGAVVHATAVAEQLAELAPDLPVEVVAHPPNLPLRRSPLPNPRTPLRILVFGLVRAYKGVELALDAAALLRERGVDVELTVAGRFWEPLDHWRDEVTRRGLDHTVTLDDRYVPDHEVDELFARHHVLLAPYRAATQSGIVPLAQAAGRPVVATAVGGLAEAVRDGQSGRLAAPGDAEAIADALLEVAEDLDTYASGSAAAATSWEQVAEVITGLASG